MTQPLRVAQLANFVGPASGGMKTAVEMLGRHYVESGVARLLITPGARDRVEHTARGTLAQVRAPAPGGRRSTR